jgi:hypothetical protein
MLKARWNEVAKCVILTSYSSIYGIDVMSVLFHRERMIMSDMHFWFVYVVYGETLG